jgi:hypothetical protein
MVVHAVLDRPVKSLFVNSALEQHFFPLGSVFVRYNLEAPSDSRNIVNLGAKCLKITTRSVLHRTYHWDRWNAMCH